MALRERANFMREGRAGWEVERVLKDKIFPMVLF